MRAVWVSWIQMLDYMRRDLMLFAACFAPILAGLLFRYVIPVCEAALAGWFHLRAVISPYYGLIDVCLAMLSPVMFCFASAMVALEEADGRTAAYLFITPLRRTGYLLSRLGLPSAASFLITLMLLSAFKLTALSPMEALLLAAGGTLQGEIVALLILTLSSNKLEGMAVAKLSGLILLGAAAPFFVEGEVQHVLCFLPSFWMGKAARGNEWLDMLYALALSGVWIWVLFKRYMRKL